MSRFLKLTNTIINKNVIQHIEIQKDKFIIHLMSNNTTGFCIVGSGRFDSLNTTLDICKTKQWNDYNIVAHWIHSGLN